MSVSMWSYRPEICDGGGCPGDCDLCDKPKNMEDEDDMTDYIKRDAVIETVYQIRQKPADDEWANKWLTPLQDIPSADVVEVVRCKDCEYWDDHERCDFWSSIMSPHYPEKNDYCSYGERAEG